jgi:hypothetical protein
MPLIPGTLTFLGEVVGAVRSFVAPGIEQRARQRADAASLQHRQRELAHELARQDELELRERYPLGTPGRLRRHAENRMAPRLLVSPVDAGGTAADAVAHAVSDGVREVDGSGKFIQVLTGAFVRDRGSLREIDGLVGATEVAQREFHPGASIIVYFEAAGNVLVANALLSNVIRTRDGHRAVNMPLARLSPDTLKFAYWTSPGSQGSDLHWASQPLRTGEEPHEALGSAIAAFALAITAVYWELRGVRWRFGSAAFSPLHEPLGGLAGHDRPDAPGVPSERLDQELAGLVAAGLEAEIIDSAGDGELAFYVPLGARSALLTVGPGYPQEPPEVLVRGADGQVEALRVEPSHWQPSQSLAELVEALQ